MIKYQRFVSLVQLQWKYTKGFLFIILLLLVGGEGYLLYSNLSNASFKRMEYDYSIGMLVETNNPWSLRFEEYLARSYWDKIFLIALFLTILLLVSIAFRQKSVAMAEYTYLRLPVSSNILFLSKSLHVLSILLILLGVQMAMVLVGYRMYLGLVPDDVVMNQGLFLAFARWDFLHCTYPIIDPFRMIVNVFYIIYLSVLVTYLNISILMKEKVRGFIILGFIACLFFYNVMSILGSYLVIAVLVISMVQMYRTYRNMNGIWGGNKNE